MQRPLTAWCLCLCASACADDSRSVVVEISSDLVITAEANVLVARVISGDKTVAVESYRLGQPPRDVWPQTLPIIAKSPTDEALRVEAELQLSLPGMPSIPVGFGEAQVKLQSKQAVPLRIERNCVDQDGDGFGIGFGCDQPDCDDSDERVPREEFCPDLRPRPDAGVPDAPNDAGPIEAGLDAGPTDSGPIDVGGEPCGTEVCTADQKCLAGSCRKSCATSADCGDVYFACLETFGVCICRIPCSDMGANSCGPFECVDGCCEI